MSQQRRIGDAPVAQRIGNYIWRRPKQPRYSRVSEVRARTIGQVMRDTRGNKSPGFPAEQRCDDDARSTPEKDAGRSLRPSGPGDGGSGVAGLCDAVGMSCTFSLVRTSERTPAH